MFFVIFIISILIFIPIILISSKKENRKKNEELNKYMSFIKLNGMNNCQSASFKNIVKIDIDNTVKLIGLYSYYENESIILKFDEILDFEVIENGNSVVSSRTGSAIAGGLLFGGLGAIAGASGSRTINNECTMLKLKLKIYTNDVKNSVITLDFLENSIPKVSDLYENLVETINKMISFLKIARESNRQQERKEDKKVVIENTINEKQDNNLSKLKELAELKEQEIISDKEFQEAKKKILSKI
jgi:hypothetical protein